MGSHSKRGQWRSRIAGTTAAALVAAGVGIALPITAVAASGTLPGGTALNVAVTSPTNGQTFPAGSSVTVNGTASIGAGNTTPNTALVTVIDNSGSTVSSAGSCGGDLNGDGSLNDVLDCEIASAKTLDNAAVSQGTIAQVGAVVFATAAVTGDVGPGAGDQLLTGPATDANAAGGIDIQQVFSSVTRNAVGLFTSKPVSGSTNFADAITKSNTILASSSQANKIVVFMSDGSANVGGNVNPAIAMRPAGTIIYTFAVGSGSSCSANPSNLGSLQHIADVTGGTCTQVVNPSVLPSLLPTIIAPSLTSLTLSVDGGTPTTISGVTPSLPAAGPASVTYSTTTGVLTVGSHTLCVKANGTDAGGAGSVQECRTITINPYPVTITALPQSKVYGSADPTFTYSVVGLQTGDTLTTQPTCAAANPHTNVGSYTITCSGATASSKYAISYSTGTLTVTPKPITITADNQSKAYGAADPTFTYQVSGLVGSDTLIATPTCTAANPHTNVGSYAITCSGADAGTNYTINYAPGTLTVGQAVITITADNQNKTYGQPDPAFTSSTSGLVGSDTLTTNPTCTVSVAHTDVGTYPITCSGADAGSNYTIQYNAGTLTVNAAVVTISADNQSTTYGQPDPPFTFTVTGLVGSDTLTATPTCAVSGAHTAVGTYPIICSGAAVGGNYTLTYSAGTLTVNTADVTITADNQRKIYGQPDPPFTFTVTGLVGGDTLTTNPTCTVSVAHTDAGSYPITCSGAAASTNYAIAYAPGTLTVTKAAITISADNQSKIYGQPDPSFTFTTTGLVGSDTLTTNPTCLVSVTHTNAGSYPITCSGAVASTNYTIAYLPGTLTVSRAIVAITPDNQTKAVGAPDPTFTWTTSGLVGSDTLLTNPTCGVSVTHTAVGTYPITCSGADAGPNYTVTYPTTGTLTVVKATPTIVTTPSPSVPAGGQVSDVASLTSTATPTGVVTFTLYGPGDTTCATAIATRTGSLTGGVAGSGNVTVGGAGTYRWVATYLGDANNNGAVSACGSELVVVTNQILTGHAYGLALTSSLLGLPLLNIAPIPDTGPVATTSSSSVTAPCVVTIPGLVGVQAVCANVTTLGSFPGRSTANASVAAVTIGLPTLPVIAIAGVQSTSTSTCAGSSGTVTIAYLKVGSVVVISRPTPIAPNTKVNVGVVKLVLNEQIPFSQPDKGLTVNAIHVTVNTLGLAKADIIVASAESDIGNCP